MVIVAGKVFTFGVGSYGKLGHGNDSNQLVPKVVEELEIERIASLSCGADHMAALTGTRSPIQSILCFSPLSFLKLTQTSTVDGDVFTWGCGGNGRLGHGSERDCKKPTMVKGMTGMAAQTVECGGYHMGVTTGASLYSLSPQASKSARR
jgi:alpha-tubulin suppressor-like RCC1 family protein